MRGSTSGAASATFLRDVALFVVEALLAPAVLRDVVFAFSVVSVALGFEAFVVVEVFFAVVFVVDAVFLADVAFFVAVSLLSPTAFAALEAVDALVVSAVAFSVAVFFAFGAASTFSSADDFRLRVVVFFSGVSFTDALLSLVFFFAGMSASPSVASLRHGERGELNHFPLPVQRMRDGRQQIIVLTVF
jgi:hypothetical protein